MVGAFEEIIVINGSVRLTPTNGLVTILRFAFPRENCKSGGQNMQVLNCYVGLRGNPRRLGVGFLKTYGLLTGWVVAQIQVAKGGTESSIIETTDEARLRSSVAAVASGSLIASFGKYREIQKE